MIVVRVELWSAITGEKKELARAHIANTGTGSNRQCDYAGETFIGRNSSALDRGTVSKRCLVKNYPRLELHVWNLVTRMLTNMGYTK